MTPVLSVVGQSAHDSPLVRSTWTGRLPAIRYHCRLNGKPASVDRQLVGLYNACLDSPQA